METPCAWVLLHRRLNPITGQNLDPSSDAFCLCLKPKFDAQGFAFLFSFTLPPPGSPLPTALLHAWGREGFWQEVGKLLIRLWLAALANLQCQWIQYARLREWGLPDGRANSSASMRAGFLEQTHLGGCTAPDRLSHRKCQKNRKSSC